MQLTVQGLTEVTARLDAIGSAVASASGAYATVGTNLSYARYVHDGTRPHPLAARNARALFWPGASHPVRSVNHPGYKGNPFLTDALTASQPEIVTRLAAAIAAIGAGAPGGTLATALYECGLLVEAAAKERVNVRTGTLRRSLTTEVFSH